MVINGKAHRVVVALVGVLIGVLCVLFVPTSTAAANDSTTNFEYTSWVSDYYISADDSGVAKATVTDRITVNVFESNINHGIFYDIPLTWEANGEEYDVNPEILTVVLEGGSSVPYSSTKADGYLQLKIGSESSYLNAGEYTYVVVWEASNVTAYYGDTDTREFYWTVTPAEHSQNILYAETTVRFKDTNFLNYACYDGVAGGTQNTCAISDDGTTVTASVSGLGTNEALTVAIAVPVNAYVTGESTNSTTETISVIVTYVILILLSFSAFGLNVFMAIRGNRKKRDEFSKQYGNEVIIPQYLPPANITPIEASIVLGTNINKQITSGLLDLAVNDYIDFQERELNIPGVRNRFIITQGGNTSPDFSPVRHQFLTSLGTLPMDPARSLPIQVLQFLHNTKNSLKERGFMGEGFVTLRNKVSLINVAIFVVSVIASMSIIQFSPSNNGLLLFVFNFLYWLILFLVMSKSKKWVREIFDKEGGDYNLLQPNGYILTQYLMGLKKYIMFAEADRIHFLQSSNNVRYDENHVLDLYEPLLPWAALFGLEKTWAGMLDGYYDRSPNDRRTRAHRNGVHLVATTPGGGSFYTMPNRSNGRGGHSGGGSFGGGHVGGGGGGGRSGGW